MKIYFWGSGKIGLKSLGDAEKIGILPDGFIDSDSSRWGSSIGGIKIYSPDILYDVSDINVFITCAKVNEVKNRLMSMGISEQSIFEYNSCELFFKLIELQARHCLQEYKGDSCHYNRIFFELQNGWVLGGVESWAYEMASMLRSGGYRASLLLSENSLIRRPYPHSNMLSLLPDVSFSSFVDEIIFRKDYFRDQEPIIFVNNFAGSNFYVACLHKIQFPDEIKIVAVIHNDEELYYDAYIRMEGCISVCLYISFKMRDEMIRRGFPEEKLRYLPWKIDMPQKNFRSYSQQGMPLKLGYAGRITITQKRVDLFIRLFQRLKELQVDFVCDFAGDGEYLPALKEAILQAELQNKVCCLGSIPREDISSFWQRHDIYLSCSEWEGHSISQAEAMSNGAVPIVTDVSGARDDVNDGENGFVVAVGDIESMARHIKYLYDNRYVLSYMGKRASTDIREKCANVDIMKLWREILS